MALKFKLQRFGRKGHPFYHVVVADSRSARNGRFIEKVGHYDPMPDLSLVELNEERVQHWFQVGVRPTDSVANLFRIKKINLSSKPS